jgi:D-alanine-D-alanine ligase
MGGWSSEREVSLWSGQAVYEALKRKGVDAYAVDTSRELVLALKSQHYDRAFNVMHGTGGEDGVLQAVLELQQIPYTGSGVLASALAMDKLRTKRLWKSEGLPTPDYLVLGSAADAHKAAERFGYPYIIKPSEEGSSVGVSKVKSEAQIAEAYKLACGDAGRVVMAEQFIAGGEYTCAVLDGHALPLIRIEPDGEFYDYNAKYISDKTRYHCPTGLHAALEHRLRTTCARAFELIGARGWGRIDFMLDKHQQPWLIEANLVPGMTSHSLVPMAAKVSGIDFDELCWAILETTLPVAAAEARK